MMLFIAMEPYISLKFTEIEPRVHTSLKFPEIEPNTNEPRCSWDSQL